MIYSETYDHRDEDYASVATPSTAITNVVFGPNREGYIWYIERLNWHVGGTHTAAVKVYSITTPAPGPDEAGRQDFNAAATDGVRDYTNPIIVPPGYFLVVNFSAGTLAQNDACLVTIQRAWCLTNPSSAYGNLSHAERLALSHQEHNEDLERRFAQVVGGSGWQYGTDPAGLDPRATENQDDLYANAYQPFAPPDPADPNTEGPLPTGIGQYVGGNRRGAQHPVAPDLDRLPDEGTARTP